MLHKSYEVSEQLCWQASGPGRDHGRAVKSCDEVTSMLGHRRHVHGRASQQIRRWGRPQVLVLTAIVAMPLLQSTVVRMSSSNKCISCWNKTIVLGLAGTPLASANNWRNHRLSSTPYLVHPATPVGQHKCNLPLTCVLSPSIIPHQPRLHDEIGQIGFSLVRALRSLRHPGTCPRSPGRRPIRASTCFSMSLAFCFNC